MNEIQIFQSEEFGAVRTITIENEPWFVGKDVAEILGYERPTKATVDHVDEDDRIMIDGKTQSCFGIELGQRGGWLINESGLYALILSSKLPSAKKFKRWVTAEVLPTIRKHGAYMNEGHKVPTTFAEALRLAADQQEKILYIYWQYYSRGKTDPEIAADMEKDNLKKVKIKADNAEPKTIRYFQQCGFRVYAGKKLTRLENTKKVKRFKKIICSDACKDVIRELKDLTFAVDKQGEIIEDEFNIDPHTLSAIWYGIDDYEVARLKGYRARRQV